MNIDKSLKGHEIISRATSTLKTTLQTNRSCSDEATEIIFHQVLSLMVQMLEGPPVEPVFHLAPCDPGTGKTEALCSFLNAWKSLSFQPPAGALIVLATHKEIKSCISRSGLDPIDYAVLTSDEELNDSGLLAPEAAPVLFTTQEMLRRRCHGRSFAEADELHFKGLPRSLRVWDEAFLPATPKHFRKDTLVQPLEELRLHTSREAMAPLDSLSDSLRAESIGEVVQVPEAVRHAFTALPGRRKDKGDKWADLRLLAGQEAVVSHCNQKGLHLAGAALHIPADFAPALILDASGRVRETYKALEASGKLKRLADAPVDYSNLRIRHWNRAASRSALDSDKARREVLTGIAQTINASGLDERWLIVHHKAKDGQGYDILQDLGELVGNPDRLAGIHWGNHHGTNDYRDIRRVVVLGPWGYSQPAYSALHVAAEGPLELATDKETLDSIRRGENAHHLLQAICRASVRQGTGGVCGDCVVLVVGKYGADAQDLFQETFPGAHVSGWTPAGMELKGAALKVAQVIQEAFEVPGVLAVPKRDISTALGWTTTEQLRRVIIKPDFKAWMAARGLEASKWAIETCEAA